MPDILDEFESIPVGSLGIIAMHGCKERMSIKAL